jgi:amino acid adenylation domain-containing protein
MAMFSQEGLFRFLEETARKYPDRVAVVEPGVGEIHYRELDELSNLLRDHLQDLGIRRGDRVGFYLHKSIDSVAAIFGILKSGAAYVPVDPTAPPARNAYILMDCSVKAVILEEQFVEKFQAELDPDKPKPELLVLEETGRGEALRKALAEVNRVGALPAGRSVAPSLDDLAYILYTSGSTGRPKGVMLTHRAAISYVDWCSEVFSPARDDRFSSHAPFHFDLSILDIYVPIKHGATLVLINEEVGKDPQRLAALMADERITMWYSTPSILSMMAQYGKMDRHDYSALRVINFAGEVFPIKHLRTLKGILPKPRYFNLYGPTETNVCTYYEVPETIPPERTQPFPIGKACSHYRIRIVDENGEDAPPGEEGELVASGPGMMIGYWNLPERTANAFLVDETGERWYRTGDVVFEDAVGNYIFVGRRDRMVKKRGYRIELGEIEAGLYRHPEVKEAAVIALPDPENGVMIKAFLSFTGGRRPSIIEMKRFCVDNLPAYMVPDVFAFADLLPKTSTDKINYQLLKEISN